MNWLHDSLYIMKHYQISYLYQLARILSSEEHPTGLKNGKTFLSQLTIIALSYYFTIQMFFIVLESERPIIAQNISGNQAPLIVIYGKPFNRKLERNIFFVNISHFFWRFSYFLVLWAWLNTDSFYFHQFINQSCLSLISENVSSVFTTTEISINIFFKGKLHFSIDFGFFSKRKLKEK